ncbi:M20/M25/M40 family metallo-hydrolase [Janthinobacterium fluminis]|uniref:M20/M25/M40 family metallo-hydrolase n=1 Tax=Janthinobacterium fluminis TaxID=2987524 RepID=A0ABT5K7E0_9BURK|nr:M20/M25/M40 family metallo-hydrolase [Janthinobacterium fluminis]MDC8760925.1 M20/M25/M40 family metallo-hydrolase [Janthinobacterium fluminis]
MEIQMHAAAASRMAPKVIALLLAGLFAGATSAAESKKIWITVGDAAYTQLQKVAPQTIARESRLSQTNAAGDKNAGSEKVHLVEVDEEQMLQLSAAIHHELKRCGGFMFHASENEGQKALKQPIAASLAALSRPAYVIDNQTLVTPMLPQMQDSNIAQTINDLSAFTNRYYTTSSGVNASNWLKNKWAGMAAGRSDISVSQFTHPNWAQKSVILTINGTDNAAEVVVLGAHLDSINSAGTGEATRAPGADDDASGVASMTEALRAMIASNYKPRRTIKMIGYAAEEVGLRGSQEIARNFKANNVNVVGVMQLDMTNYKGSPSDIYIYTDYTDSQQNTFVVNLLNTYLPTLSIGYDKCGYGCSDHASWTAQGYYASMPFEAAMSQDNPYIHTVNDTYASSGNQALHALKFARLATAYAVELGSDGPGVIPPTDRVETFNGSLSSGQKKTFGPYKVAAGGSFKAVLSGTGDTDLYVRKAAVPTTTTFDCKSDGPSSTENCTLNLTANGDVYVMLNGYTASTYTLTLTYLPQ